MFQRGIVQNHVEAAQAPLLVLQRMPDDAGYLFGSQGLESEDPAPGEERGVDLKGRVFGGGADEGNGPVLNMGQNHVLLRLVKAVDFVHEEDGAPLVHPLPFLGFGHHPAQVGDTGSDRADRLKVGLGNSGDETGQGGLAAARRPPQNQGGQPVGGDGAAQHPVRPEDVVLADELIKVSGTHPLRQGGVDAGPLLPSKLEQGIGCCHGINTSLAPNPDSHKDCPCPVTRRPT